MNTVTIIRRGHGCYVRASDLTAADRTAAAAGGVLVNDGSVVVSEKVLGNGRRIYRARLTPGYAWDSADAHYPEAVSMLAEKEKFFLAQINARLTHGSEPVTATSYGDPIDGTESYETLTRLAADLAAEFNASR